MSVCYSHLCQKEPHLRHSGVLGCSSDICIRPLKLSAVSGVLSDAKHREAAHSLFQIVNVDEETLIICQQRF